MKQVFAFVPAGVPRILADPHSIMKRADMNVGVFDDSETVSTALLTSPPDLFLVHDQPRGSAAGFLGNLFKRSPGLQCPVFVIHDGGWRSGEMAVVKGEVDVDSTVEDLNLQVATVLSLPNRRSPRLPVTIAAEVKSPSETTLATVVTVSATGMLIESSQELFPSRVYEIHLKGLTERWVPPLPVRILREEPVPPGGARVRLFSAVLEDVDVAWMEELLDDLFA